MRRGCLPLLVSVVFGVGVPFSVCPAAAQYSAQLEVERDENRTITRLELLNDRFYTLRAERSRSDGVDIDRMGLQLPGSILGLDGYTSLFLERQPSRTVYGPTLKWVEAFWRWVGVSREPRSNSPESTQNFAAEMSRLPPGEDRATPRWSGTVRLTGRVRDSASSLGGRSVLET
jgi:hypothetical protein